MYEGLVIDQRFRLGPAIRRSSVAVIHEAVHRNGVDAWVKLPCAPEYGSRLVAEATLANALGENAVTVRDDGTTDQGMPYLVLEPVIGWPLDQWKEGSTSSDDALQVALELCSALGKVHDAGHAMGHLTAEAILVLPRGGVCLLELEHALRATPVAVKEDVLSAGRVLHTILQGRHGLGAAMDAAGGRYATIGELRDALIAGASVHSSAPMPAVRPSKSQRSAAPFDPFEIGGGPRGSATPSIDLDVPPVGAFSTAPPSPLPSRAPIGFGSGVAVGASLCFLTGSIALAIAIVEAPDDGKARAVARSSVVPSASLPSPAREVVPPAEDTIELDDPPLETQPATNGGATDLTFAGDRSPRLVILDGRLIGTTAKELRVPCGAHTVKVGGKGASSILDLPCEGEQVIVVERDGKWRVP